MPEAPHRRWLSALLAVVLFLSACAQQPAPAAVPASSLDDRVATLQQTVVAQQTQVSALQKQVVALSTAVVPRQAEAAAAKAPAIPTLVPPVGGIAVDGTSRGSPQARLTLTEYSDYQ